MARSYFEDDLAGKGFKLDPAVDDYRTPEMVRLVKALIAARVSLAETVPTTLAGIAAVLRFAREQSEHEFFFDGTEETKRFVA